MDLAWLQVAYVQCMAFCANFVNIIFVYFYAYQLLVSLDIQAKVIESSKDKKRLLVGENS